MNTRGFTLVELLAVVLVLGIILTITIFAVNQTVNDSEVQITDIQIENIEESAEIYYLKEGMNDSNFDGETEHCVNLSYLIQHGYLDNINIIDAYKKNKMNGSVSITYKNNAYIYKYKENVCPKINS